MSDFTMSYNADNGNVELTANTPEARVRIVHADASDELLDSLIAEGWSVDTDDERPSDFIYEHDTSRFWARFGRSGDAWTWLEEHGTLFGGGFLTFNAVMDCDVDELVNMAKSYGFTCAAVERRS